MLKHCIVLLSLVVLSGAPYPTVAYGQSYTKGEEIPPQKLEALLAASAELDAFFESHHRRLERARPEELPTLQEELTTEPAAILQRHNLTSTDLAQWRQQLEAYGDDPTQAIEDPHFHTVVKRLLPKN